MQLCVMSPLFVLSRFALTTAGGAAAAGACDSRRRPCGPLCGPLVRGVPRGQLSARREGKQALLALLLPCLPLPTSAPISSVEVLAQIPSYLRP